MARDRDPDLLLAGRYRRLRTIGVGGTARVHLAEDELLGRAVAIKQLHAAVPDEAALRFEREAKLGASLNHPNLVSIFDIAVDAESVVIVMEHVDGETLESAIARGPLPPERVAAVIADVAAGLDHAHGHGVVHRDVKPGNILLRRDGVAKLADLGIATAAERTAITRSDVILGTASYMAPEQLAGERVGPAGDVYALAAVAFEALSGRKVRRGRTPVEVAHEVVRRSPPDLRASWPEAPADAADAIARAMARDPVRRPPSAGDLAAELDRALRPDRDRATAARAAAAEPTAALAPRLPVDDAPQPTAASARTRVEDDAAQPTAALARTRVEARGDESERFRSVPSPRSRAARSLPVLAALAAVVALAAAGVAALDRGGEGSGGSTPDQRVGDRSREGGGAGQRAGGTGAAAGTADPTAPSADSAAPDFATERPPKPDAAAQPATDPAALNDRGYRLMQAGDHEQAIPLLEQAVSAFPAGSQDLTYAYALYNLGRSLRLAGRPAEAVPILERRLRIPDQTETVRRELEAARRAS